MTSKDQLLPCPCPFCGSTDISDGEVLMSLPNDRTATQSMCRGCGALGPEAKLPKGEVDYGDVRAIAAWNRRAKVDAVQVRNDATPVAIPSHWLNPGAVIPVTPETVELLMRALKSSPVAQTESNVQKVNIALLPVAAMPPEVCLQALQDQAQELDMGYGTKPKPIIIDGKEVSQEEYARFKVWRNKKYGDQS